MKRSILAAALVAAMAGTSTASAAFFIENTNVVSTERGDMGKFQPYNAQGRATFAPSDGNVDADQARYKDAHMLVDLAYSPISQRGTGDATIVNGFGDDLPFVTAMTMVLPNGWRVYLDKGQDEKIVPQRISFSGARSWPEVLRQIGDRYELHFHIDWFERTVMMAKGRPSMASQAAQMKVIPEPGHVATPSAAMVGAKPVVLLASASNTSVSTTSAVATPAPFKPALGGAAVMPVSGPPPVAVQAGGFTKTVVGANVAAVATSAPVTVAAPKPYVAPIPSWVVSTKDHTIREALRSWSRVANWTFEPEHWAVPVDIPITAGASFNGDFKTAVRQLIGTTELGATPLQPCFYSNHVVRVVPINEMCDRMNAR